MKNGKNSYLYGQNIAFFAMVSGKTADSQALFGRLYEAKKVTNKLQIFLLTLHYPAF